MSEQKQLLDEDLIHLYLDKGHDKYFRELVERYVPRMHAYVRTHFGNGPELDDIIQEIFMGVFASLPKFRFEASFKTWLYSIAYRQVKRFQKQASSKKHQLFSDVKDNGYDVVSNIEDQNVDVSSSLIAKEEKKSVIYALSRLPEKQKEVMKMRYIDELKITEIACILNKSVGTIKATIFKAIKNVKAFLEENQNETQ